MDVKKTILNLNEFRKGEYPDCLDDVVSILVSHEKNSVPWGYDVMSLGFDVSAIEQAEARGQKHHAASLGQKFAEKIDAHRINIGPRLQGLFKWGYRGYVTAFIHAQDSNVDHPPISVPISKRFEFEIRPHQFDLGLTGRVLTDGVKSFEEQLFVGCDIYDAFDLARQMSPESIVAKLADGSYRVLQRDHKTMYTPVEINKIGDEDHVLFTFSKERKEMLRGDVRVLPSDGEPTYSKFWKQMLLKGYGEHNTILFGQPMDGFEFMDSLIENPYLFWSIYRHQSGQNPSISYADTSNGKWPELKDRMVLGWGNADVDFGTVRICYDAPAALHSLLSVGETITDVWVHANLSDLEIFHTIITNNLQKEGVRASGDFEKDFALAHKINPEYVKFDNNAIPKLDIVYDRRAGITPSKPLSVRSNEVALQYAVHR